MVVLHLIILRRRCVLRMPRPFHCSRSASPDWSHRGAPNPARGDPFMAQGAAKQALG